ncbi:MAG: glycogen debranching enzyme N-terminal domain-containing protein [Planctomycetia bacterium]|nr:glycogen debranching enzyme N-terminal domain-containing protein [Planctomycetia bacterium]
MPTETSWSLSTTHATSSGSASGIRHSRTQALLSASIPGAPRPFVLVNGFEAWVDLDGRRAHLSAQRYAPDIVNPDERSRLLAFATAPWPRWRFAVEGGAHVAQELQLVRGRALVALRWSLEEDLPGFTLGFRPFISGRDPESLHHDNEALREASEKRGWKVTWRPYDGVPEINAYSNAAFEADPHWYHNFQFDDGSTEDLFSPGVFRSPLRYGSPVEVILSAGWEEVVSGMILPEQPVLWAEAGKAKVAAPKKGPRRAAPAKKAGKAKAAQKKATKAVKSRAEHRGGGPRRGKKKKKR